MAVFIYCDLGTTICSNYGQLTNIPNWYRSVNHTDADGSTILKVSTNGQVTSDVDFTSGLDNTVITSLKAGYSAPQTIEVDFNFVDKWMYHNPASHDPDAPTPIKPLFKVNIIDGGGPGGPPGPGGGSNADWAGHGETGNVVDSLPSHQKNNRLNW